MGRSRTRVLGAAAAMLVTALAAGACGPPPPPPPPPPSFDLITTGAAPSPAGMPPVAVVNDAAVSADGSWGVFSTYSENVLATDPGEGTFLRDLTSGTILRISSEVAHRLAISPSGDWVALQRVSSSHIPGQSPVLYTVDAYERATGQTHQLPDGQAAKMLSVSDTPTPTVIVGRTGNDIYDPVPCETIDILTGVATPCPAPAPQLSDLTVDAVSRNGRFVVRRFIELASSAQQQVLWDRQDNTVVTVPATMVATTAVSDDGLTLTGLAQVPGVGVAPAQYALDTGTLAPAPAGADGAPMGASRDARHVQLHQEVAGDVEVEVWDTVAGTLRPLGSYADPIASPGNPSGRLLSCSQSLVNHVTDAGRVCVLTTDDLIAADTNSTTDAYLAG